MSTVYFTGRGDDGTTGLLSSARVSKADSLIEAIGSLDELNSAIGVAMAHVDKVSVRSSLASVQNDLFVLGANLASTNEKKVVEAQIKHEAVERLEAAISQIGAGMPELKSFVLPGGDIGAAQLHVARAAARRAERCIVRAASERRIDGEVVAYLNRLSSFLFAAALYVNHCKGVAEANPTY